MARDTLTALEAALAAVIAWGYAVISYRVWDTRFSVPVEDGADGRGSAATIKGILENGWWLHNPDLGAPFGQNAHDFPANGETLQLLAVKGLGWILPGYGEVMNAYYLGGFGVLAAVTILVLRHLRIPFAIALPIAAAPVVVVVALVVPARPRPRQGRVAAQHPRRPRRVRARRGDPGRRL